MREEQPKEEGTYGTTEESQLESEATNSSSVSGTTGPPSPLIPTDASPQTLVEEASKDNDEIPYPYPNPDLANGKHHGSMWPPTTSEEIWKVVTKEERREAIQEYKEMEAERQKRRKAKQHKMQC